MKLEDFKIGEIFYWHAGFKYLCTDKGTRTITAIHLDYQKNELDWFQGPPYNVDEITLDETDIKSCYTNEINMLTERVENLDKSYHPSFLSEDFVKMFKNKDRKDMTAYPRKRMLKIDRVGNDGKIWHPYSVMKTKNNEWIIKIFELFDRTFSEMNENEFVKLKRSSEEDLKKRYMQFHNK